MRSQTKRSIFGPQGLSEVAHDAYHFAYHLGETGWTLQYAPVTESSRKVAPSPMQ